MREIKASDALADCTPDNRTLGLSRGQLSQDARQRRSDRYHQDTYGAADQDIGQPRILRQDSRWARGEPERGCAQLRLDQGGTTWPCLALRIFSPPLSNPGG
jgi:hypothetical protein